MINFRKRERRFLRVEKMPDEIIWCFNCQHYALCTLRHQIEDVRNRHLFMLNTETGEEPNAVMLFEGLAAICKEYKRSDEG